MTTTTANTVRDVDAATLKRWLDAGEAIVIDVREPGEYAGEHLAAAQLLPLSRFTPAEVPQAPGKKVVLHCQRGNRSAQAGQKMLAAGIAEVLHLRGGLQAWKDAGYETVCQTNAPISLQRQVQIVAGSLVVLGTLLGVFLSPWFLLLSGFVGAGLTFAGLTGTCGLAMVLAKLPYNQRATCG